MGYLAELKKNCKVSDDEAKETKELEKLNCFGFFGSSSGELEKIHVADAFHRRPAPLAYRDPLKVSVSLPASHAEVPASYPDAIAAEPFEAGTGRQASLATGDQEAAIRAWLAQIGETDETTIDEVVTRCRNDSDARAYYLGRARHATADDLDDRRSCHQCSNLRAGACTAAKPGAIVSATRGYRPAAPEMLRRCGGYAAR